MKDQSFGFVKINVRFAQVRGKHAVAALALIQVEGDAKALFGNNCFPFSKFIILWFAINQCRNLIVVNAEAVFPQADPGIYLTM